MEDKILNELVKHIHYGMGQIIAFDGKHILVKFEKEEMGFAYPEAFFEYLIFVKEELQSHITTLKKDKAEEHKSEKTENARTITKLDKNRIDIAKVIDSYVAQCGTNNTLTNQEILQLIKENGITPDVMYLSSDLCYNKTNAANLLTFKEDIHLYKYIDRGKYQILGSNFPYTGDIQWKKANDPYLYCIGKWENGRIIEWYPNEPKKVK